MALDLRTLAPIARQHGQAWDEAGHREAWRERLGRWPASGVDGHEAFLPVAAQGVLQAYAWLRRQPGPHGHEAFVLALVIDPACRSAGVVRALLARVASVLSAWQVSSVSSHVYKGNDASLRFHRKLGFEAVAENGHAVALQRRVERPSQWGERLRRARG